MNYLSIFNAMVRMYQIYQSLPTNLIHVFFATIRPNLANALPAVEGASIGDYMGEHNINSMFLKPVIENEIIIIVKLWVYYVVTWKYPGDIIYKCT